MAIVFIEYLTAFLIESYDTYPLILVFYLTRKLYQKKQIIKINR